MSSIVIFLAFFGATSLLIGLISLFSIFTFAFNKIEKVENLLSAPENEAYTGQFWVNKISGRPYRANNVFLFFITKKIPKYGEKISARFGNEKEKIPLKLKLWGIIPCGFFYLFTTFFIISGYLMKMLN